MSEITLARKKEKAGDSKPRILVLASGSGTNFQEIINGVETGSIDAEIIGLIANRKEAYALTRAQNHQIPFTLIPSKGQLKDPEKRRDLERQILVRVIRESPDIIVLAGWMLVLSDSFIQETNKLGTRIINLHPALLTQGLEDHVETSLGRIPVIRGFGAIEEAYEMDIPLSGVTVHEVIPGHFDTGPIIAQEEVIKEEGETLESWEHKIHQTEYRLLPQAINSVINQLSGRNLIQNG